MPETTGAAPGIELGQLPSGQQSKLVQPELAKFNRGSSRLTSDTRGQEKNDFRTTATHSLVNQEPLAAVGELDVGDAPRGTDFGER